MLTSRHHKRFFISILTICLLWACSPFTAFAQSFEDLTYMTEEYYPFNYTEKGEVKGISTDLLRMTWEELGITPQPIEAMPWARVYDRIQHEQSTVLFSMARTPEREDIFAWAGPIMVVRFVLIAKKEKQITLKSLEDLKGHSVGTLREDISDTLLQEYKDIARIDPVANMEQNIHKLLDDRLDMVAYEERSWQKIVTKLKLPINDFETVFVLRETPVYYAFHWQTPPDLVTEFQQALDRIKARPEYQQVLDKYLD